MLPILLLVLFAAGCGTVLTLSIWPGLLADLLFGGMFFAFLLAPALPVVLGLFVLVLWLARRRIRLGSQRAWQWALGLGVGFGLLTLIALVTRLPTVIAFRLVQKRFDAAAEIAPARYMESLRSYIPDPDTYVPLPDLDTQYGVFAVDSIKVDPRGGVYFRVYKGMDGIGPDIMSSGFAYQPNADGTPFGAARYTYTRLREDWYVFHASNDWY